MNCYCADVVLSAMAKPPPPDGARRFIPPKPTLNSLRKAAQSCTACPLYRNATQTVFGAGPAKARLMLVGEQPGDAEDRAGLPFVGPAGRLLDRALAEAGIDRSRVYVTNAVKHFKWVQRGKRRLHSKPGARDPGLLPLARGRNRRAQARGHRLPRRHRRTGPARPRLPRNAAARRVRRHAVRPACHGNDPSLIAAARTRPGDARARAGALHCRAADGRRAALFRL